VSVNVVALVICALLVEIQEMIYMRSTDISLLVIEWLSKIVCFVLIDFIIVGGCISWFTKTFAEKFLLKRTKSGTTSVESLYAWDIHCNSFFPVIVFGYYTHVSNFLENLIYFV
jgi:hypothetical protein